MRFWIPVGLGNAPDKLVAKVIFLKSLREWPMVFDGSAGWYDLTICGWLLIPS